MEGKVAPAIVNPVPARVAEFTVTDAVPEEVSVTVLMEFEPSATFPNAKVLTLRDNCREVPLPLRATVAVLPLAELLEIVRLPLARPVTVGVNVT